MRIVWIRPIVKMTVDNIIFQGSGGDKCINLEKGQNLEMIGDEPQITGGADKE